MAELNELTINGSNYTFEDDVARGLATAEERRARAAEQSLQTAINGKVDKVSGKGLSTNDYTNDEKAKLAGLNNYDDTQVRQLIAQTNANFANYYTKTESYSATEVDTLLRTQRQGQFVVVNTLPAPSADTMFKIYLVPSTNPETQNVKDEFVTLESNGTYSWEQIGTTAVDLSGYSTTEEMNAAIASALASYYTKSEVDEALGGKQNTIEDLANIRSGAQAGSTAVQPSTLNNVVKNTVAESGVYDVSANNDNTKFKSLSALLSSANLNTLIPTDIRKGGMSIKFVLSSDNKYMQYFLTKDEWSASEADWEKMNLEEEVSQLSQDVVAMVYGLSQNTGIFINKGWMDASGTSNYLATSTHAVIPIESEQHIDITPRSSPSTAIIAFLSNYERISQNGQQYNIIGSRYSLNTKTSLVVPDNARFLFVGLIGNNQNLSPTSVVIDGYDYMESIYNAVTTLNNAVTTLNNAVFIRQIDTTLVQGFASAGAVVYPATNDSVYISELSTRVRSYIIQGNYTVKTKPGYVIRAISVWRNGQSSGNPMTTFQVGEGNASNLFTDASLTEYTKNDDWPCSLITFCKTDATAYITPDEEIIAELIAAEVGLVDKVEKLYNEIENNAIRKAVFMGDSITHGVYSYWNNNAHAETDRYNGFDISNLNSIVEATAYHGIPYYFGLLAKCPNPVINLAKRGSGYVADSRNLGNALAVANSYDFSDVDFVALCFGVNDYIQGKTIGDITTKATGTIIGNMCATIEKILTDNPLCKVVVYSPYNTWGQVSYGGDYTSNTLYGNEASNYALGHTINGNTLQNIIDAEEIVCNYYGIQIVNLSKSNVINRLTIKNILIDGLHPSKESYIKLAAEIYGKGNFGD